MEEEPLEWVTTPASPEAESKFRRYLDELTEHQGWMHHVADAESGEVFTTRLDRPVGPLSRAERLSRFGPGFDPSPFGGPNTRLTARNHYQASPIAWLTVWNADFFDPNYDLIGWNDIVAGRSPAFRARISQPPQGRCVATVVLSGRSQYGQVGHVRLQAYGGVLLPASIGVPLAHTFDEHTIDLIIVPTGSLEIRLTGELGLRTILFHSVALESRPVLGSG